MKSHENFTLRLVEEEGNYFSFHLNEKNNFLANMIRRTIMLEVPTVAVEEVIIEDNKTIHIDDIIIKRLGLIPLASGKANKKMNIADECSCESNCEQCEISFTLEGSYDEGVEIVSSADMQIDSEDVLPVFFTFNFDGKKFEEPTPVVSLADTHSIKLSGKIRKGNGDMHAKWNPVCTLVYKEVEDGILFNVETSGTLQGQEIINTVEEIIKEKIRKGTLLPPKPK